MPCLFQGSTACSHIVGCLQQWPYTYSSKICIISGTLKVCQCLKNWDPSPLMQIKNERKKKCMTTSHSYCIWKPLIHMQLSLHLSVWNTAQVCTGTSRMEKGTGLIKIKLVLGNNNISPKHSHQTYHKSCFWLSMSAYGLVLAWNQGCRMALELDLNFH